MSGGTYVETAIVRGEEVIERELDLLAPGEGGDPFDGRVYATVNYEIGLTRGASGRVLLIRERGGAWSGECLDRPMRLYAGTRVGGWLHRQLRDHARGVVSACLAGGDGWRLDLAVRAFVAGWAEDLAFARDHWTQRDTYWCCSEER